MTACLIVRDEGARLASCLQSTHEFVDATVVCDTGSTDDTVDIALQASAIVTSAPWTDDFAAARNAALSVCTTDWVLSVDADETVQGVASWLAPMLAACEPGVAALSVQIVNAGGPDRAACRRTASSSCFAVDWFGGRAGYRGSSGPKAVSPRPMPCRAR